jgi:hypothetical protein
MPGLGTRPGASRDPALSTCFNTDLAALFRRVLGSRSRSANWAGDWPVLIVSHHEGVTCGLGPLPIFTRPSYGIADQWMRLRLGSTIVGQLRRD